MNTNDTFSFEELSPTGIHWFTDTIGIIICPTNIGVIAVDSIEETEFAYNNEMHPGYEVRLSWTYTDDKFSDYQKNAIVILIKSDIKYYVVQI